MTAAELLALLRPLAELYPDAAVVIDVRTRLVRVSRAEAHPASLAYGLPAQIVLRPGELVVTLDQLAAGALH